MKSFSLILLLGLVTSTSFALDCKLQSPGGALKQELSSTLTAVDDHVLSGKLKIFARL